MRQGNHLPTENLVKRAEERLSRYRGSALGTRSVELTAVGQLAILVKKEQVRSAGCLVGQGYGLIRIKEVRKVPGRTRDLLSHMGLIVLRTGADVIGTDRHCDQPALGMSSGEAPQLGLDVLHERTVVANKHNQKGRTPLEACHRDPATPYVGEIEVGCGRAKWQF